MVRMLTDSISLEAIRPQVAKTSDKYSWRLYSWLKRERQWISRVYKIEPLGVYFLGEPKEDRVNLLTGSFVNDVLRGRAQVCAWMDLRDKATDITEWFWPEYLRIGRCIFDTSHGGWMADDETRFGQAVDGVRHCNWCGQEQHMIRREVVKISHVWRNEKVA